MKNPRLSRHKRPLSDLPDLPLLARETICPPAPTVNECHALWNKYGMPGNIRLHSQMVANIAATLANRAYDMGLKVDVAATLASGLLHDLAKSYCISYGGSHAMLGAAWTLRETGHYGIAQGVFLHVHWPWEIPTGPEICNLPIFVIYADKRVRHDRCVTLRERFDDLLERYGKTEKSREYIKESFEQGKIIESRLSRQLEMDLHEYTFDSGRLVD